MLNIYYFSLFLLLILLTLAQGDQLLIYFMISVVIFCLSTSISLGLSSTFAENIYTEERFQCFGPFFPLGEFKCICMCVCACMLWVFLWWVHRAEPPLLAVALPDLNLTTPPWEFLELSLLILLFSKSFCLFWHGLLALVCRCECVGNGACLASSIIIYSSLLRMSGFLVLPC